MPGFATIIACGGRAKRFGADKRHQVLGGESLMDRAVARALSYGAPVALAVRGTDWSAIPDLPVLQDPDGNLGPIGALASGFDYARTLGCGHILLIACDQPFLPTDLSDRLAGAIGDEGVALPVSNGHDQNMAGLWRCDPERLQRYIEEGGRSLRGLAELVGIARVRWEEGVDDPFADIDTPADLVAAQARITKQ